jgi:uncharacterized Zn finger protein (UPF0148 family)
MPAGEIYCQACQREKSIVRHASGRNLLSGMPAGEIYCQACQREKSMIFLSFRPAGEIYDRSKISTKGHKKVQFMV